MLHSNKHHTKDIHPAQLSVISDKLVSSVSTELENVANKNEVSQKDKRNVTEAENAKMEI